MDCWHIVDFVLFCFCLVDRPDDVGDERDIAVDEDVVGGEYEQADFIVDGVGLGPPKRYCFFFFFISLVILYIAYVMYISDCTQLIF